MRGKRGNVDHVGDFGQAGQEITTQRAGIVDPLRRIGVGRSKGIRRNEAVRKAGSPGIHIEDNAVSLTCAGKMASLDVASGLRPSDGLLIAQMPELRTNYDQLSRVAHLSSLGMHIVDLMTPLIAGFGGGAEGTAIVTVASHLLGVICYNASYHFMGHMHVMRSNNTDRMGLWVQAMAGQALANHTPLVSVNDIYAVSGLGTTELLWEVAAGAAVVVSQNRDR